MPLFAFISGYVFNATAPTWMEVATLLKRKFRRLGIPLVVVSYLFYTASCAVRSNLCLASPLQILFSGYAHFWFLQATLLIMVAVTVGTIAVGSSSRCLTAIALPISVLLFVFGADFPIPFFSIDRAIYLLPYFLLGHALRTWSANQYFVDNPTRWQATLIALVACQILFWSVFYYSVAGDSLTDVHPGSIFGLGLSATSCLFLFLLRLHIPPLAIIGPFSFAIYLFHPFFASASRRLLFATFPGTSTPVLFSVGLLAGVVLPIVLHHVAVRHRIAALLLLGIYGPPTVQPPRQQVPLKEMDR
jgi:peptidoglycan/LPS O-acetylase OafA/YrhL